MNKGIIVGIIAVLVVGSGVLVLTGGDDTTNESASISQPDQSTDVNQQDTPVTSENTVDEQPVAATAGSYVDYSPTALADAAGTERVLFFHAEWCSTCKFHDGQLQESGVPEGVTVIKADFDNDTDLKSQYGVNIQSTFVHLDANGEVVQTWPFASGIRTPQDLFDAVLEV